MGWTRWRLEWSQHDHWVKNTYWEKIPAMRTVPWPFSECFCDYVNVENICIRRVWLAMLVHTDANSVHVRSVGIACLAIRLVWLFDYIWQVHAWPSGPRRRWGHLGPFWLQQGECGLNKKIKSNILGWNGFHGCQFVSGNTLQCPCFSCVFVKFSGLPVYCKFLRGCRC